MIDSEWYYSSKTTPVIVSIALIISLAGPAIGIASAQTSLPVEVDIPSEATTGASTPVSASATIPDVIGSHESELTVTLLIDGEEVESETITIQDGKTATASFSPTFDSTGTHEVTIKSKISIAGRIFNRERTRSIQVVEGGASSPELPDSPSGTITSTDLHGPALSVPATLRDEVDSYRENTPKATPYAFVLAQEDQLYLVFSKDEPTTGLASVSGVGLPGQVSAQDMSFDVVLARSVSFNTQGQQTSVEKLSSNPGTYSQELVQVQANHRQISVLSDTDKGKDTSVVTSAGVLVEDPITASDLMSEPGSRVKSLAVESSAKQSEVQVENRAQASLQTDQPRVFTVGFQTGYWSDSEQTVNGIFLTPGSKVREFISTFGSAGTLSMTEGRPLLYVIESSYETTNYDSVRELSQESSDGELVSVEANMIGQRISVQESIEHGTSCGETTAQVQTPSGPVCVDLLQDSLIDAGAAWSSVPESRDDLLFVIGISSQELDQPSATMQGTYRMTGEVVSTARIDESLPDGRVLVVYEMERTGNIETAASGDAEEMVQSKVDKLRTSIRAQMELSGEAGQSSSSGQDGSEPTSNSQGKEPQPEESSSGNGQPADGNEGTFSQVSRVFGDTVSQVTKILNSVTDLF